MNEPTISTKTLWLIAALTVVCSLLISNTLSAAAEPSGGNSGTPDYASLAPGDASQGNESRPVLVPPQPQSSGKAPTGQTATARQSPGIPTITDLTRHEGGLVVSWLAPTAGGEVGYYRVQWRVRHTDTTYAADQRLPADARSAVLANLNGDEAYQVRVMAGNEAGNSVSAVMDTFAVASQQPSLSRPTAVRVDNVSTEAGRQLLVSWEELASNAANPPTQYLIQWRKSYEAFNGSRQLAFQPDDLSDRSSSSSAARAFSATLESLDTYKLRVVAVRDSVAAFSAEALLPSPSNEIRHAIETLLAGDRGNSHPWLVETWQYINRASFSISTDDTTDHAGVQLTWLNSTPLNYTGSASLRFHSDWSGDDSYLGLYTHELAHVYTLSNHVAANPGPVAIAYLYFSQLANAAANDDCEASELYADAAKFTIFPNDYSNYWETGCPFANHQQPTPAAIEVVRQAFAGEVPDWFYATYERPDGSLDLPSIWAAVKAIEGNWYKTTVVYQLRHEFGGYCDAATAKESVFGSLELAQPWRAGGCD